VQLTEEPITGVMFWQLLETGGQLQEPRRQCRLWNTRCSL